MMKRRRRSLTLWGVKIVRCNCGHLVSGDTADQLLRALEAHIDAAHAHTRPPLRDEACREHAARSIEETTAATAEEER